MHERTDKEWGGTCEGKAAHEDIFSLFSSLIHPAIATQAEFLIHLTTDLVTRWDTLYSYSLFSLVSPSSK